MDEEVGLHMQQALDRRAWIMANAQANPSAENNRFLALFVSYVLVAFR